MELITLLALIAVSLVIIMMCVSFFVAIFGGGPFVPTPMKSVHKVLKAAKIKKGDVVYDIGAGDGRYIHFAEKDYGAKATGFEIDPFVFTLAKLKQWILGWKGTMLRADFQKHNLKKADVVICYMLPKTLAQYQKKFKKELRKGTKIISYAFHIGSLKPKKTIPKDGRVSRIFIYEV